MNQFLIGGNWKMHKGPIETRQFMHELKERVTPASEGVEILICPPSISLATAMQQAERTKIKVGAQNVHFEDNGAFTGEISTQMLNEIGCSHVIVGHSERREHFGETDAIVHAKTRKALSAGIHPVICVGESLEQRKNEMHKTIVKNQMKAALNTIPQDEAREIVIAYEPLWAIGTGESAEPGQAQEMHAIVREEIESLYDAKTADRIPILYGGSMKPDNAESLLKQTDINGGLIGGASLEAKSFADIIGVARALFESD